MTFHNNQLAYFFFFLLVLICLSLSPIPQRFQDVEEAHLTQMKDFINLYIDIVQNNHDLVGQVKDLRYIVLECILLN